jgi:SAM-dependent methyltransferase
MTPTVAARGAVASLPPGLRWRARNTIALARWLWMRTTGAAGAYAEDFWALHDRGDWDGFAGVILRFCEPRSIVDVGCGDAKLLAAVRRRAPVLPLLGVDSSAPALERAAAAGVPVAVHDLASTRGGDLEAVRALVDGFDVVMSLETAEHLPPWASRAFVETLGRGRVVVFSAAHPGQAGTLHMNERPGSYWRARFAERGYAVAPGDTAFRAAIAALDLPPWYAANIQLFERRA